MNMVLTEFCGIDPEGSAVEAFAVREWIGGLAFLKSMAASFLTLNEKLCYGFISMFIVYLLNHCAMGFLQKKYVTRNRSAIQCCSVNKILNFFSIFICFVYMSSVGQLYHIHNSPFYSML